MPAQLNITSEQLIHSIRHQPDVAETQIQELLHSFEQNLQELRQARLELAKLQEQQRLARAERFAASSEQSPQYALFNEAEQEAVEAAAESDDEVAEAVTVPAHTRRVAKRKPLPADLPRVVVEHDLADKTCSDCGADKVRIGTKTSEQLDIIPAQVFVIEHQRHSYKCPCCVDAVPTTAPMPAQPIPKSIASAGLLAHVAVAKYDDGLPLYRQVKQFERIGVSLSRQTLAAHMVRGGELVLPLVELMTRQCLAFDVLQMDETRVQVLDEDNRPAHSQSWMWVMRGGPPAQPVIRYHYDPGRGASVPLKLLNGYQGYLQTDGYGAYRQVFAQPGITGLGCWARARRRFIKAQQAQPKGKSSGRLTQVLAWINKLYALERSWLDLLPDERQHQRQTEAKPLLDKIEAWALKQDVPPKTLLGKAVSYLLKEWPRLIVYLNDGRLTIDNNLVENAIRPFALGRKNWLFSHSVEGAEASAALYSLIETARANGLNTYAYLKHLFTMLPNCSSDDELQALLPWHVDRETLAQYTQTPKA
ncbi:MAG: IS66 family transposase [Pseudomonadota bacterium]